MTKRENKSESEEEKLEMLDSKVLRWFRKKHEILCHEMSDNSYYRSGRKDADSRVMQKIDKDLKEFCEENSLQVNHLSLEDAAGIFSEYQGSRKHLVFLRNSLVTEKGKS